MLFMLCAPDVATTKKVEFSTARMCAMKKGRNILRKPTRGFFGR